MHRMIIEAAMPPELTALPELSSPDGPRAFTGVKVGPKSFSFSFMYYLSEWFPALFHKHASGAVDCAILRSQMHRVPRELHHDSPPQKIGRPSESWRRKVVMIARGR